MFEPVNRVVNLLRDFKPVWFVAGGWALDLFLGKETRPHDDIEIAIFRDDQLSLRNHLQNWNFKKAVKGELIEWTKDEFLKLPIHEIHCFNKTGKLEVLLNEKNTDEWVYRRDEKIRKPISELYLENESSVKFLRPEIVLLYKSKNPRAKDEQDFRTAEKYLDFESRNWLKNAISICYREHHWLENLK